MLKLYYLLLFTIPILFSIGLICAPRLMHWVNEWYDSTQIKGKNQHNLTLPEEPSKTRMQVLQVTGWLLLGLCLFLFGMLCFLK